MARAGSPGVERTLCILILPSWRRTKSVKVPPVSIPTNNSVICSPFCCSKHARAEKLPPKNLAASSLQESPDAKTKVPGIFLLCYGKILENESHSQYA